MTQQVFLFIESNTTGTGRLFVERARERGFRPVLFAADPSRYRYLQQGGPQQSLVETVVTETTDRARLLERVRDFAAANPVAGVWSSAEYYISRAALAAAALGLVGPDAAAIEAYRNKSAQRQRLKAAGIDSWPSVIAHDPAEAVAAAESLGYPVIVKPISGSGSVGVRQCGNADAVRAQAGLLASVALSAVATDRRLLVERKVPGEQYSVELFGRHVVGITRQHYGPLPYFVAIGHDHPARLPAGAAALIERFALDACAALGLTWGPLHVELRFEPASANDRNGRVHLIEVNPRLAGGCVPELVRHATGIDLIQATVDAAAGRAPALAPAWASTGALAASLRFVLAQGGRLGHVPATASFLADPRVRDVTLYRQPGDPLVPVGDFHDRIGHVITAGHDAAEAAATAESIASRLSGELALAAA
jgi:S-sulfo-L-cysteine synthase (3-phospho-L-serine-dependent)